MAEKDKVLIEIETRIDKSDKQIAALESKMKKAAKTSRNMGKGLGEAQTAMSALNQRAGAFIGKLNAIVGHPIIAIIALIVAGLKFLYDAISTNEEAMNGFNQIVSKLVDPLKTIARIVGEDIAKAFKDAGGAIEWVKKKWEDTVQFFEKTVEKVNGWFKGLGVAIKEGNAMDYMHESGQKALKKLDEGFKTLAESATKSFVEMKKRVSEASGEHEKFVLMEQKLVKTRRELNLAISQTNVKLQKERNTMNDMTLPLRFREESAKRVKELILEQLANQEALLNSEISLAQQKIKSEGKSTENLDALNKLEVKRNALIAQREQQLYTQHAFESRLLSEREQLSKDQAAMRIRIAQEESDKRLAIAQYDADFLDSLELEGYERQVDSMWKRVRAQEDALAKMALNEEEYEARMDALRNKAVEDEKRIYQARADFQMGLAAEIFGNLSALADENSKTQKALAVSEATINTWVGAAAALRDPNPVTRWLQFAAVITAGLGAVKNILSTSKGSTGGGGASSAPPEVVNVAPDLQGGGTQELRAYIVEDDLVDSKRNAENTRNISSF
jgi:chromosome segregation ATPase